MSSFCGLVEELPGISVDCFEQANCDRSTVFFLSHCHSDHMQGLFINSPFFQHSRTKNQYMYCTSLTKQFLVTTFNLGELSRQIKELTECQPVVVSYRDPKNCESEDLEPRNELLVTVTAVPAGHCPGSVMFLFEANRDGKNTTILYTGDFRMHPDDFSKVKPLHIKVNNRLVPRTFDNIYLDTTFYDERVDYLPSRQESLQQIIEVVKDWLGQNDKNIIVLEISANYGSEDLFVQLSRAVNRLIHVRQAVYESYRYIPELSEYITSASEATPIHACMKKNVKNRLTCRDGVVPEKNILTIIPSVLRWIGKDMSNGCTEWDRDSRRFYVCYSCHSSFSELRAFIDYFKPRKVYPCVCPRGTTLVDLQKKLNDLHFNTSEKKDELYSYDFTEFKSPSRNRIKADNSSDDDF